jgi:hypothetical protein
MTVTNKAYRRGEGSPQRVEDRLDILTVGKLAGAGMLGVGNVFLVHDSTDVPVRDIKKLFDKTSRFTDIQTALDACRAGANDYVFLQPKDDGYGDETPGSYTGWAQTANIDLDKSHTHLVGLGSGRHKPLITFSTAKSIRVGPDNTLAAPVYGIELANLYVRASGTSHVTTLIIGAAALGYVYDTFLRDVEIDNFATTAATAEVTDYGARTKFVDSILGGLAAGTPAHPDDNYLQVVPTAPANRIGGRLQDTHFIRCLFQHFAAAAGDQFVTLGADSAATMFRDCMFYNYNFGVADMTLGIVSAGYCFAHNCGMVGATGFGTTGKVLVTPGGVGLNVLAADVFNPSLAIDGAEPVAADT